MVKRWKKYKKELKMQGQDCEEIDNLVNDTVGVCVIDQQGKL